MIRISTIFIAICMVLVAASLGLVLHSVAGFNGSESALVALTALTFLVLYNAVSMRLRDRSDVGGQIADLSRGTADLARQVAEFGRRLAAVEGRVVSANSDEFRPHPGRARRDQRTRRAGQAARGLGRRAMKITWPRGAAAPAPPRLSGRISNRRPNQPAVEIAAPVVPSPDPAGPVATTPTAAVAAETALALAQPAAIACGGEKRGRGKPARYLSAADGDAAAAQGAVLRGGDAAARRQGSEFSPPTISSPPPNPAG